MRVNLLKFNDGSVHFVTTKTYQNTPYFLDKACCDILIGELNFYRKQYGFKILGYVIMPDHLHLLVWWDRSENKDLAISRIMQGIKSHSAKRILEHLGLREANGRSGQGTRPTRRITNLTCRMTNPTRRMTNPTRRMTNPSWGRQGPLTLPKEYPHQRMSNQKHKIWQSGFYDFNVVSTNKLLEKLNYMHNNPFKDKRIKNPKNYFYSSGLSYETNKNILPVDKF